MTSTAPDTSTPAGLIRLGNAFCDAKALLTAVDLDLFSLLRKGPATTEEIRTALDLHGRGLSDFLQLLVALGLLVREGDRYSNAEGADRHLVRGEKGYVGGFMLRSDRNLYPAWGKLAEGLRTGRPQSVGDFDAVLANPKFLAQFVHMMDALTHVLGPELIERIDFTPYQSILDIGGCRGNMAGQIVKANPHLVGHVFDMPQMEQFFDKHMAEYGVTGRVHFHGGSFFEQELPKADLVMLGHVLHDWDRDQREFLVNAAYKALNPGGTLLVYDRMLDDDPRHVENLVISLDMLLVTDGGSEYPVSELRGHAEKAGFTSITDEPFSDFDTLLIAKKP
ncbi:SAM-dependent methyltransferase [Actinoalloteichus hoggarensis]|uniref:Carminomycin 4-O-methyltransferase n=1 Tax=Actinoalloteichus hoggarensis TaxID=1470176 RepID=A0A221W1S2_9PSEU|nr:methyltransferase [Actinoalloteichus hoggarensis]ASO19696.1 Carminomycin 4-O-methyltransferase [Actinoalloteichus hoggarensis]MBB5919597.1 SAM-dependent methyltransferase [Actinoalloteichus hoggarensis]